MSLFSFFTKDSKNRQNKPQGSGNGGLSFNPYSIRNYVKDIDFYYKNDSLASIIVEEPVFDAFKKGYYTDEDSYNEFENFEREHKLYSILIECLIYGRKNGYCNLAIFSLDSKSWDQPLLEGSDIKEFIILYNTNLVTDKDGNNIEVHPSRLITFYGIKNVISSEDIEYNSILIPILESLELYRAFKICIHKRLFDNTNLIFRFKNLIEKMSGDFGLEHDFMSDFQKQFDLITKKRDFGEPLALDGDTDVSIVQNNSPISEIHDAIILDLAKSAKMPVTKLFKQTMTGLASGDSELINYYDYVESNIQKTQVIPALNRIAEIMGKNWIFQSNPLIQLSEKEKIEIDTALIDNAMKLQSLGASSKEIEEYLAKNDIKIKIEEESSFTHQVDKLLNNVKEGQDVIQGNKTS